jgi:hypothetical protein
MITNQLVRAMAAVVVAIALLSLSSAHAMTLREFRKFTSTEQGTYIGAAVSMLAYSYAANGDPGRGRCVLNWYFGKKGMEAPGPREITVEMTAADSLDPDRYQAEGVIMGVVEKACPSTAAKPKP